MAKPIRHNDQALTDEQVRAILREKIAELGSQQALAKEIGISQPYLSDVMNHRRDISHSILDWLNLQSVTTYISK